MFGRRIMRNTLLPVEKFQMPSFRRAGVGNSFLSSRQENTTDLYKQRYRIILNQHLDLHVEMEAWLGEGGVTDNFVSDIANFIF